MKAKLRRLPSCIPISVTQAEECALNIMKQTWIFFLHPHNFGLAKTIHFTTTLTWMSAFLIPLPLVAATASNMKDHI